MQSKTFSLGFWSGIIAFCANILFVIAQVSQLVGVLSYPYDEIYIYTFSLLIVIPFLIQILALHYVTCQEKKIWSHAALIFTSMYAVFVTANYTVQLATVIPATLRNEADGIQILVQTPHSMFWDFDAIGYICMGLASVFVFLVFKKHGIDRWVRITFLANALVTPLIAFVYFYPQFSERLLLLGIPWTLTSPLMMLFLALWFKKRNAWLNRNNLSN